MPTLLENMQHASQQRIDDPPHKGICNANRANGALTIYKIADGAEVSHWNSQSLDVMQHMQHRKIAAPAGRGAAEKPALIYSRGRDAQPDFKGGHLSASNVRNLKNGHFVRERAKQNKDYLLLHFPVSRVTVRAPIGLLPDLFNARKEIALRRKVLCAGLFWAPSRY
ncbi:hypothetical protein EVAR_7252_1 [Eumeta japonica]|uniref:Uncharacterized protein n=1 Tax=Eumeta variegata TaxID=151549 RepID=A0A4C1T5A3_EUMVA|nr:hypothetical protein EVAR_7252_1 [Eumeta japonica]